MRKTTIFLILATFILVYGCKNSNSNTAITPEDNLSDEDYMTLGKEIAFDVFTALSTELSNSIKDGGLSSAISYCNTNAIPLTDSLSKVHNVDIKRTSLKFRNPQNEPTEKEQEILNQYEMAMSNGKGIKAQIGNENGSKTFYAPIIIKPACLTCHGNPSAIPNTINDLYPNDLATGYNQGDLRGMWSIKFKPTIK